jgi:glycosyltransferase involved in cell wall biosynthesis
MWQVAMDKDYPKVSIMIATYNRAHYLADAIEISLAEDYPNFKVIVSDNASTDDTGKVIRKYISDSRFRYFRNAQNLGSGPNYRKLLYEYANGQFGHFLTDDDYFIVNKVLGLETVWEYFLVKRIHLVLASFHFALFLPIWSAYTESVESKDFVWVEKMLRKTTFYTIIIPLTGIGFMLFAGTGSSTCGPEKRFIPLPSLHAWGFGD